MKQQAQSAPAPAAVRGTGIWYLLSFIGQSGIFWLVTNYLMYYYTDFVGLSPLAVGGLFLVAKVWDVCNDILFGHLLDRAPWAGKKRGRFMPCIRSSALLLPLATVLVFSLPLGGPALLKVGLAFVTYLVWYSIYTMGEISLLSLPTAISTAQQKRTQWVILGRFGALLGALLINLLAPILLEQSGPQQTALLLGTGALITLLPLAFSFQEQKDSQPLDRLNYYQSWRYLKANPSFCYFLAAMAVQGMFRVALPTYIAVHLHGNLTINAVIGLFSLPLVAAVYAALPRLTKRWEKMQLYRASLLAFAVVSGIRFFLGYKESSLYLAGAVISAFVEAFSRGLLFTFAGDCAEFGQKQTGLRRVGTAYALQTAAIKFGIALSGILTALFLTAVGYTAGQPMASATSRWMWAGHTLLPVVGTLLAYILLRRYALQDREIQEIAASNQQQLGQVESASRIKP